MATRPTFREVSDVNPAMAGKETTPREKVFRFLPRLDVAPDGAQAPGERGRDWGAALDLVRGAAEAIRLAEERARSAEEYARQLEAFHKEQINNAELRATAAGQRAELAELRTAEAEAWLVKLHDAIAEHFGSGKPAP